MFSLGKKYIILFALVLAPSPALAHGVEKLVPADAKNFKVQLVEPGGRLIGQTLIGDDMDGPIYQPIYKNSLAVVVSFESKDKSGNFDFYYEASGINGEVTGIDSPNPMTMAFIDPTAEQYLAASAKKVNPASLVALSVKPGQKSVVVDAQYKCARDNETNAILDPKCQEDAAVRANVPAQVLTIDLK